VQVVELRLGNVDAEGADLVLGGHVDYGRKSGGRILSAIVAIVEEC
jgi:hypothetical protein